MGRQGRVFNVLSLVALGMTVVVLLCYVSIAVNPFLPFNPFPPDGNTFVVATVTLTSTPERAVAATWTPTVTPTVTPTPPPTFTPTVTPTPEPTTPPPTLEPTATPEPTAMPTPRVTRSPYPFTYELSYETPFYGCAWTGVAGTVEDIDGNHLIGYPIHVWGGGIDTVVYSGDKQMYGDSGWEQFFNSYPMEVSGVFKVQLHSKDNPNHPPASEEITLDFSGFCSNALARIVFIRNH